MTLTSLTPNAEALLKEILDSQVDNDSFAYDYWKNRFEGLTDSADAQLRSSFKELSQAEMIEVLWGDGIPDYIEVLSNGLSYFDIKEEKERKEKKEKRANRWHDIMMLIIGAFLGGIVEFLLFKFFGIGG